MNSDENCGLVKMEEKLRLEVELWQGKRCCGSEKPAAKGQNNSANVVVIHKKSPLLRRQ